VERGRFSQTLAAAGGFAVLVSHPKFHILTQLCCSVGLAVYDDLKVHSVEGQTRIRVLSDARLGTVFV
jgi:hypothetical protein